MDWELVKAVLAELVAYFKKVFAYFYGEEAAE